MSKVAKICVDMREALLDIAERVVCTSGDDAFEAPPKKCYVSGQCCDVLKRPVVDVERKPCKPALRTVAAVRGPR